MAWKICFSFIERFVIDTCLHLSVVYVEQLSSKAIKYFSSFLTRLEIVSGGIPYFKVASLLYSPLKENG